MNSGIIARFRGARRIEIYILFIISAIIILLALNGETGQRNDKLEIEKRLEAILSDINGVEKINVMITRQEDEKVVGVLIVTRGIDRIQTQLEIQNAVKTLLDVELSKIKIIDCA